MEEDSRLMIPRYRRCLRVSRSDSQQRAEVDRRRNHGKAAWSVRVRDWLSVGRSSCPNQSLQSIGWPGTPSEPLRTHLSAKHPANSRTLHRRSLSLNVEKGRSRYRLRTTCQAYYQWWLSDPRYVFVDPRRSPFPSGNSMDQAAVRFTLRSPSQRFSIASRCRRSSSRSLKSSERTTRTTTNRRYTTRLLSQAPSLLAASYWRTRRNTSIFYCPAPPLRRERRRRMTRAETPSTTHNRDQ